MLDIDKSNRQMTALNKYLPWIIGIWLCYEIVAGDRFIGIFAAISFIGFRFIDKLIRSKAGKKLQNSELNKPFQWKFELLIMASLLSLLSVAVLIAIYFE